MMRRALLTVFAVFYLSISSGATVHFHYCMGKLVDWSLTKSKKDSCKFCGMSKKDVKKQSCCKDDYKQAKVDVSKKALQQIYQFAPTQITLAQTFGYDDAQFVLPIKVNKAAFSNAPPAKECIPLFIRNCTYIL